MFQSLTQQLHDILHKKLARREKIFYVSLQRCGTKSFSYFFQSNGFKTASWNVAAKNQWPLASLEGNYHKIISSADFRKNQVFDDGPWHHLPLMKYLYWKIPNSRFVFFNRPFDDWIKSMKSHSNGVVLGDAKRHCMVYGRLREYYVAKDSGLEDHMRIDTAEEIYARFFDNHAMQIRAFFEDKSPKRFFEAELYDPDKFKKLGEAWAINFSDFGDVHIHRSGYPSEQNFAQKN